MKPIHFQYECPECGQLVDVDFTPERPAPFCQNHDSPSFSDPGDPVEVDAPEECPNCHEALDEGKIMEAGYQHIEDVRDDYDESKYESQSDWEGRPE